MIPRIKDKKALRGGDDRKNFIYRCQRDVKNFYFRHLSQSPPIKQGGLFIILPEV